MTPTQRTLQYLRDQGIPAQVVEKWVTFASTPGKPRRAPGVRRDLFGLWDIVALRAGRIVGIQCCAMSGRASHYGKLMESPYLAAWMAGGEGELWAWRRLKPRGIKRVKWEPEITALAPTIIQAPA